MLNKKKVMVSLVTLVFAVILCGAGSAATPGQSVVGKNVITHSNNVAITINGISPTTARGHHIYVKTTTKNLAKTTSKAFNTKYYLVTKKSLSNSKIYLGTQYFNAIKAGKASTVTSSFLIPQNTNLKAFYVAAVTDKNHVSYSSDQTRVYPKEIDSGVVNVKTYGQFKWHTYLTANKTVVSYSQFYNPQIKKVVKQTTQIAFYQKGLLYMYIVPKISGKDDYWTILPSTLSAENYYKNVFKPNMIKNGPNH